MDSKSRFDVLSAYLHQPYFKVLARNAGLVLHFGTVIIDGVYGITEEFCNLRTVVDAQTNQGENAEFRIQQLAFTEHDAFFGLQQVIEFIDKIGEKVQEGSIKVIIELLQSGVQHLEGTHNLQQLFHLPGRDFLVDHPPVGIQPVDINGAEIHETAHILLLDVV